MTTALIYISVGSGTYTTPSNFGAPYTIYCWGAGGGGGFGASSDPAGGGGGGGYSELASGDPGDPGLAASTGYQYQVGAGGQGGTGTAGGTIATSGTATWFNGASLAASSVGANPGLLGATEPGGSGGGAGGTTTGAVGTTKKAGGSGGNGAGANFIGGGGGGAGGPGGTGGTGAVGQGGEGVGSGGGGGACTGGNGGNGVEGSGGTTGGVGGTAGDGTAGGAGGTVSGAGGTGSNGSGGGGGYGAAGNGGAGNDSLFTAYGSYGAGGGGGSCGAVTPNTAGVGGLFGGGGAGAAFGKSGGNGANGGIIIVYTETATSVTLTGVNGTGAVGSLASTARSISGINGTGEAYIGNASTAPIRDGSNNGVNSGNGGTAQTLSVSCSAGATIILAIQSDIITSTTPHTNNMSSDTSGIVWTHLTSEGQADPRATSNVYSLTDIWVGFSYIALSAKTVTVTASTTLDDWAVAYSSYLGSVGYDPSISFPALAFSNNTTVPAQLANISTVNPDDVLVFIAGDFFTPTFTLTATPVGVSNVVHGGTALGMHYAYIAISDYSVTTTQSLSAFGFTTNRASWQAIAIALTANETASLTTVNLTGVNGTGEVGNVVGTFLISGISGTANIGNLSFINYSRQTVVPTLPWPVFVNETLTSQSIVPNIFLNQTAQGITVTLSSIFGTGELTTPSPDIVGVPTGANGTGAVGQVAISDINVQGVFGTGAVSTGNISIVVTLTGIFGTGELGSLVVLTNLQVFMNFGGFV